MDVRAFVLIVTDPDKPWEPSVAVVNATGLGEAVTHLRELGLVDVRRNRQIECEVTDLPGLDAGRLTTHVAVGEDVDGPWVYLPRRPMHDARPQ